MCTSFRERYCEVRPDPERKLQIFIHATLEHSSSTVHAASIVHVGAPVNESADASGNGSGIDAIATGWQVRAKLVDATALRNSGAVGCASIAPGVARRLVTIEDATMVNEPKVEVLSDLAASGDGECRATP